MPDISILIGYTNHVSASLKRKIVPWRRSGIRPESNRLVEPGYGNGDSGATSHCKGDPAARKPSPKGAWGGLHVLPQRRGRWWLPRILGISDRRVSAVALESPPREWEVLVSGRPGGCGRTMSHCQVAAADRRSVGVVI